MNYDVILNRTGLSKLGLSGQSNEGHSGQRENHVRNDSPTFIQSERGHTSTNASGPVSTANATPSRKISYFSMFDSGSPSTSAGQTGKVETKLLSMWHNMKYGWTGKMRSTSFSKEQPIILLGKCYHRRMTPPQTGENSLENAPTAPTRYENSQMLIIDEPQSINFATESPVEELGRDAADDDNSQASNASDTQYEIEGIENFKRDFVSRLWMTYRREFPLMNDSNYTSDCGWGCMIRSGQMLLAQGLVAHLLGRDWRWDADTQVSYTQQDIIHRKIIKWFGDSISKSHPFSIHTLVQLGKELGKKPGDWWGPGAVAILLRNAVKLAAQEISDLDKLNVYVAQDCAVYIQDILDECQVPEPQKLAPWQQQHQQIKSPTNDPTSPTSSQSDPSNFKWKSLILLVPLRLGTEKMNLIYGDCLKAMLSLEHCIGIIGGRPKHSLYFVGYQEDKLIHLDPHYCQDMVDVNQEMFSTASFHCRSPRKMKLIKMDPCCCIGFYCATKADFDRFVSSVQPFLLPARTYVDRQQTVQSNECNYPMFVFCRGRNTDQHHQEELPERIHYSSLPTTQRDYEDDDDEDFTEEFVFLEK